MASLGAHAARLAHCTKQTLAMLCPYRSAVPVRFCRARSCGSAVPVQPKRCTAIEFNRAAEALPGCAPLPCRWPRQPLLRSPSDEGHKHVEMLQCAQSIVLQVPAVPRFHPWCGVVRHRLNNIDTAHKHIRAPKHAPANAAASSPTRCRQQPGESAHTRAALPGSAA